ncbi:hypothetical protein [Streptomyces abyssomicinicus]|uniref:hypothetical protein n=1 Tax=Streptomyces abyssomicinicus TaxID=574929 RepID=UPI0013E026BA|nr:hypothetical protein [Streptomyces abyssomicinicus]
MGSSWAVRRIPDRFGSGPHRPEGRCGMDHEIEQVTEELPELALMIDIGDDDD